MKYFATLRLGLLLALLLALTGIRAEAGLPANPSGFGLSVTVSTNIYFVNNTITTTITVTNDTGFVLDNVYVTNDFSAPVLYTSFTNYSTVTNDAYTNGNALSLDFSPMTNGQVAQTTFTWVPQTAGFLTNTFFVATDVLTNHLSYTNVALVSSVAADLSVSLAVVSQAYITNIFWVITNDWVTYQVSVTNFGPGNVSGALVTNTLPPGTILIYSAGTFVSNNLVYHLPSLASGTGTNYQFTLLATNTGVHLLAAYVGAPGLYDPDIANNQIGTLLFVTNYLAALSVQTNSGQAFNPQNGLLEQTIQVTNPNAAAAPAVRVVLTALGTNQIFNAIGTNSGAAFVNCPAPLAAGAALNVRLQYLTAGVYPFTFAFTNAQLHAYAVPASVLNDTPPPAQQYSTNQNVTGIFRVANGDVLLEFPATLGAAYAVEYSDNVQFSNAVLALPYYRSPGNIAQWIDYGPPATSSALTNTVGRRFYRVISNP